MSQPGVKSPANRLPKKGAETRLAEPNSKTVKEDKSTFGKFSQPADIGTAPASRIYTRDYTKKGRAPGDTDLVTDALGKYPLGI